MIAPTPTTMTIPWRSLRGIVFDMDGVLFDTEPLNQQAEQHICQTRGWDIPEREWQHLRGKTNHSVFTHLLQVARVAATEELLDELIQQKRAEFLRLAATAQPIKGALAFVRRVRLLYERLALTTSSNRLVQQALCERFLLAEIFDTVVTGDDVPRGKGKPDPTPYLLTISRLWLDPRLLCAVEDSLNGVRSARAAGCFVTGLTTSFSRAELTQAGAHLVVSSFEELATELARSPHSVVHPF
ncbi:MAG: HAD family phosphatase [Candidatus Andersenbacteria bacterium]